MTLASLAIRSTVSSLRETLDCFLAIDSNLVDLTSMNNEYIVMEPLSASKVIGLTLLEAFARYDILSDENPKLSMQLLEAQSARDALLCAVSAMWVAVPPVEGASDWTLLLRRHHRKANDDMIAKALEGVMSMQFLMTLMGSSHEAPSHEPYTHDASMRSVNITPWVNLFDCRIFRVTDPGEAMLGDEDVTEDRTRKIAENLMASFEIVRDRENGDFASFTSQVFIPNGDGGLRVYRGFDLSELAGTTVATGSWSMAKTLLDVGCSVWVCIGPAPGQNFLAANTPDDSLAVEAVQKLKEKFSE